MLKGKVAERWAESRGFETRRVDRRLTLSDRRIHGEPLLALAGLDNIDARRNLGVLDFAGIIDAGLGRNADDFDKFVVRVFDQNRQIERYFADHVDDKPIQSPEGAAYDELEKEVGKCGVAEIGGRKRGRAICERARSDERFVACNRSRFGLPLFIRGGTSGFFANVEEAIDTRKLSGAGNRSRRSSVNLTD